MHELFKGMESNEMVEGSAICETGAQIQDYQSKLSEAIDAGDTESVNYFRGQIEKLNKEMGTHQGEVVGIGDENFGGIAGHNSEKLKNAQRQYYNHLRIRGGNEGLGAHQNAKNGTELGTHQGSDYQEISFLGSDYSKMNKRELESALSCQKRKSKDYADSAAHMIHENATTSIYNPKNLISDNLYYAKKAQEKVKEIESELKKR